MVNIVATDIALRIGLECLGYSPAMQGNVQRSTRIDRFKSHFGVHPKVCSKAWETLQTTDLTAAKLAPGQNKAKNFLDFLMCLFVLKTYPTETVAASRFQVNEITVRKWTRFYTNKLAALIELKVVWPDSFDTYFIGSVDCVNMGTNEPRHPTLHKDKKQFDRKGGKAGVTYEVALPLFENTVMWFNGPFQPNDGGDAAIFKEGGLQEKIPTGKKVIADKIYKGFDKVALHNSLDTEIVREFKARARSRQESINARLKSFEILHNRFRHGVKNHQPYARAVMVLCVFALENGSPLYNI